MNEKASPTVSVVFNIVMARHNNYIVELYQSKQLIDIQEKLRFKAFEYLVI